VGRRGRKLDTAGFKYADVRDLRIGNGGEVTVSAEKWTQVCTICEVKERTLQK
jgi:hypothetical protein